MRQSFEQAISVEEDQTLAETIGEFVQAVAADNNERRLSQRFAYNVVQSAVPYDGKRLPTSDMFRKVQCHDLSTGGMSFVWPHAPEFERVIVKLAAPNRNLYVVARVVSHRQVGDAKRGFLVCCKFLDRVRISG